MQTTKKHEQHQLATLHRGGIMKGKPTRNIPDFSTKKPHDATTGGKTGPSKQGSTRPAPQTTPKPHGTSSKGGGRRGS